MRVVAHVLGEPGRLGIDIVAVVAVVDPIATSSVGAVVALAIRIDRRNALAHPGTLGLVAGCGAALHQLAGQSRGRRCRDGFAGRDGEAVGCRPNCGGELFGSLAIGGPAAGVDLFGVLLGVLLGVRVAGLHR
jgi:hypothetical protein